MSFVKTSTSTGETAANDCGLSARKRALVWLTIAEPSSAVSMTICSGSRSTCAVVSFADLESTGKCICRDAFSTSSKSASPVTSPRTIWKTSSPTGGCPFVSCCVGEQNAEGLGRTHFCLAQCLEAAHSRQVTGRYKNVDWSFGERFQCLAAAGRGVDGISKIKLGPKLVEGALIVVKQQNLRLESVRRHVVPSIRLCRINEGAPSSSKYIHAGKSISRQRSTVCRICDVQHNRCATCFTRRQSGVFVDLGKQ